MRTKVAFHLLYYLLEAHENWPLCEPETCLMDLHLFWTSELRGAQLPTDRSGGTCDPETYVNNQGDECYGGHARRLTYFNQERARLARKNETAILFDLGGSSFGSPVFNHPDYLVGYVPSMLMNDLPYDFCSFSSSDFLVLRGEDVAYTKELLQSFAARVCPWLISNGHFIGIWSPLNANAEKYKIVESNGKKVGFVYMFPHIAKYAFSFGLSSIELDESSLLHYLLYEIDSPLGKAILDRLRINVTEFRNQFIGFDGDWHYLRNDFYDIYRISTVINVDILDTAASMKQAHPDITAAVLLVGRHSHERDDEVYWMLEHGPFDIILCAANKPGGDELLYKSSVYGKTRLYVESRTALGIGRLNVRINKTGVSILDFHPDFRLTADVEPDPRVMANASDFYSSVRFSNKHVYGIISSPIVGGHRGGETAPAANMCYYMDCPHGDVIGQAFLWNARRQGHKIDFAFSNLGGIRSPLVGNVSTGEISIGHCDKTLGFKNMIYLFQVSGKSIFETLSRVIATEDRGFVGGGLRAAFHEPCWSFVNHLSFYEVDKTAPGTPTELQECLDNVGATDVIVTDIEFEVVDYNQCDVPNDYSTCAVKGWQRLEKGSTYTMASSEYVASQFLGFTNLHIMLGLEPQAVCDYVKAHSPLYVDTFQQYLERGSKQYDSAQAGWDAGNRIPSVKSSKIWIAEENCPDGMFLGYGASSCKNCSAGTESITDAARDRCDGCAKGRYSDKVGQAFCKSCRAGTFQDQIGKTACKNCSAGWYSEVGWPFCSQCSGGFHSTMAGEKACQACPKGKYTAWPGSEKCDVCPDGRTTIGTGNTNLSDCVCDKGTYAAEDGCDRCWTFQMTETDGAASYDECYFELEFYLVILLPTFLLILASFACIACLCQRTAVKRVEEEQRRKQARDCIASGSDLAFPLTVMAANEFMSLDRVIKYEDAFCKHLLISFPTRGAVHEFKQRNRRIIFFSHQWLDWHEPDPNGVHYNAIARATEAIVQQMRWLRENCYLWVDYHSVPQLSRQLQEMAIKTMPLYASLSSIFVIVAPTTQHCVTAKICNFETYQRRMWCRAELFSFYCRRGISDLYRMEESRGEVQLIKVDASEVDDTILVFEGDCTCCARHHRDMSHCDKQTLRDVFVSIYADVLWKQKVRMAGSHTQMKAEEIVKRIEKQKDRIFPRDFTATFEQRTSTTSFLNISSSTSTHVSSSIDNDKRILKQVRQPLFGELISTLEGMIEEESRVALCSESNFGLTFTSTTCDSHQGDFVNVLMARASVAEQQEAEEADVEECPTINDDLLRITRRGNGNTGDLSTHCSSQSLQSLPVNVVEVKVEVADEHESGMLGDTEVDVDSTYIPHRQSNKQQTEVNVDDCMTNGMDESKNQSGQLKMAI